MPVAPEIETKTLYLEFAQAGSRLVQPLDLAELFNELSILRELAYIAHEEGDWRGFADVDVLQLEDERGSESLEVYRWQFPSRTKTPRIWRANTSSPPNCIVAVTRLP